jgi:heme/copper-type cytochrome/quinol oxidase subunit 1
MLARMVHVLGAVLAWGLFIGIVVLGVATSVFGAIRVHRRMVAVGGSEAQAQTAMVAAWFGLFMGAWLIPVIVWCVKALGDAVRGARLRLARPS